MITLRKYNKNDAQTVLSWIKDEKSFFLWCANRFDSFPPSADIFNRIYEDGTMQGFIAEDGGQAIGHLFMQDLGKDKYKFGLIIVDGTIRGKGYGRKMLECAIDYAKQKLNAKKITLSVFEENVSAYECYKKIGFIKTQSFTEVNVLGKDLKYFELELDI